MISFALSTFLLTLAAGSPEASSTEPVADPPPATAVLTLSDTLVEKLDQHVLERSSVPEERRKLLMSFMFGTPGLNFRYDDFVTRTVPETFEAGVGNCLSFTLLFIAAARYVGLEAHAREVRIPSEWSRLDNTVYRTGHVNVGLMVEGRRHIVDFEPDLFRAYRLSSPIIGHSVSDERMLAHFYNNRAAELLGEKRLEEAFKFVERAIEMDPDFTSAWNTRGVLLARLGKSQSAEDAFLTVLENSPDDPEALINLFNLYRTTSDREKTAEIQARLESVRLEDPYFQFELGGIYENEGDLARAERHYRRAVRQKEDEHRFHFALARLHFRTGNEAGAETALRRAVEFSRNDDRLSYKHKLQALTMPR